MNNRPENGYTVKLREFLASLFAELGVNSYYLEADKDARKPYIVYELRHIAAMSDSEDTKRYVMEVNAYSINNTAALDNLLDLLETKLSDFRINTPDYFIWINLAYGRLDIQEAPPLKRKRINFEIKYYLKGAY